MTDPLDKYFSADAAPAVDMTFRLSVMERVARKRFFTEMVKHIGLTALLALTVSLVWPALNAGFSDLDPAATTAFSSLAIIGIAAFAGHWLATHRWRLGMLLPR